MRKLLCRIYNLMASYPVLVVLILATATIVYLGQQYRPIEKEERRELASIMQLRQERQAHEQELNNVEVADLARRYALFNEKFITKEDQAKPLLIEDISKALKAYGWELKQHSFESMEEPGALPQGEPEEDFRIQASLLKIVATTISPEVSAKEPFLPLDSLFKAKKYLWRRSPHSEYQRIKISRNDAGFEMETTLFLPIADPLFSGQPLSE